MINDLKLVSLDPFPLVVQKACSCECSILIYWEHRMQYGRLNSKREEHALQSTTFFISH